MLAAFSKVLCLAQETDLNSVDLYHTDAPVSCKFVTLNDDRYWVYAVLDFRSNVTDPLWVQYSWSTNEGDKVDSTQVTPGDSQSVLKWSFQEVLPDLITVRLNWNAREWIFQEHFPMNAYHGSGGVSLWETSLPLLRSWIHIGDSVQVRSGENGAVYTYFYGHDFDPARPPMTINPASGSASLSIDSVFMLKANQFYIPDKRGLYFFQADSTSTLGVSLVVTDPQFPKPREISDLTEPLIYVSTRNEFQSLKEDFSSKQALDKFWLSTLGSAEKARAAIKNYYQNVEEANRLFTSYKEGWKTDRGMIYVILGQPLVVKKEYETETWTYRDSNGEEINFQFKKVSNIFSNDHYELFRDKNYDRPWFVAIDKWREGRIP